MELDVQFLFDNQLVSAIEELIKKSKKNLLLISPYIDLDPRTIDALREKKDIPNFQLRVLFGKNQYDFYRSIKRENVEFLKEFPNIEIRYNERLHAKYYQNEFEFIISSLNLIKFSVANNIEVGVRNRYASKGLLAKQVDAAAGFIGTGIDKVKQDIFGGDEEVDALDKFEEIFNSSELLYKTTPIISSQGGISGLFGKKKIDAFDVIEDKLKNTNGVISQDMQPVDSIKTTVTKTTETIVVEYQSLSASKIAERFGIDKRDFVNRMVQKGLIASETEITEAGKQKGLTIKNYMGRDYISYPLDLPEINGLKK
jgi:hypothetical protein